MVLDALSGRAQESSGKGRRATERGRLVSERAKEGKATEGDRPQEQERKRSKVHTGTTCTSQAAADHKATVALQRKYATQKATQAKHGITDVNERNRARKNTTRSDAGNNLTKHGRQARTTCAAVVLCCGRCFVECVSAGVVLWGSALLMWQCVCGFGNAMPYA